MRYSEALHYLFSRLPMFTRSGAAAYKTGLGNIEALLEALGNPERKLKTIHVAGTNGKGSSSHFLASILQEAGYKTGLFTSPHLKDFRERIRVNGEMIPTRNVSRFVEQHQPMLEAIQPSFFEMNVALAFSHFANMQVDIAVIETGLGGRLDSTNVIQPELSLITNISFDHTDLLGDTLEKIALEKAGIIKLGRPVVLSETQAELLPVFANKAQMQNSLLILAEEQVRWKKQSSLNHTDGTLLKLNAKWENREIALETRLSGAYQQKNLAGVLCAVTELKALGWSIPDKAVKHGILHVKKNTGLRGRWDQLSEQPTVICDTGHNKAGVEEVLGMVAKTPHRNLHLVWGMVSDKDVSGILKMLPKTASYYFCKARIPRAMDTAELQEKANEFGLKGKKYQSVKAALSAAKRAAAVDDLIVVGGSTFVVAEVV